MYKPSREAQKALERIMSQGKEEVLVTPDSKSIFQKFFDYFCYSILILSILFSLANWKISLSLLVLFSILFGFRELFLQQTHGIVKIYGPLGRLRYIAEDAIRDKYLQYFQETNTDGRPIPRIVRDYIYQKAHNLKSVTSFGTELDIFDPENTPGVRILHKNFPSQIQSTSYGFAIGDKRKNVRPFFVKNTINISGMSHGSLSYKAAESLSLGAKDIAFVNTGEGGYGPHGISGNDVVFQIGTGKFGVGEEAVLQNGIPTRKLNEELLLELVKNHPNIKMIQLKISQGAKPGIGGVLPKDKVTPEIAEIRKVPAYKTLISPPQHAELIASSPKESILKLMDFIERIRKITELPVGIKICFGNLNEIELLVEAMKETKKGPDAIQVDGADGGTGAGPNIFVNYVGYGGAVETLALLHQKLRKAKIRDSVSLSASGKLFTPAHAAAAFAFGADTIETARGAMLSLGCIQALKCHTNTCPTGITTNQPWRIRAINIPEKSTRLHNYLKGFHEDMLEIAKITGHSDPRNITPGDLRLITYSSSKEKNPHGALLD